MTYAWPLVVTRYIDPAQLPSMQHQPSDVYDITVICQCPLTHAGAGGESGCGAYWTLQVPKEDA
jgi:hypothetical protein